MSNTTSSAAQARSIKDTRTEQNLVNSYMNESQSYARHMFYAQQTQKENYFSETVGKRFKSRNN